MIAGLDVDRVCREMDVQALQHNISNVTFCDVASEVYISQPCGWDFSDSVSLQQDFQGVDGNFIKLFRLAQLTIEYLLVRDLYRACVLYTLTFGSLAFSAVLVRPEKPARAASTAARKGIHIQFI